MQHFELITSTDEGTKKSETRRNYIYPWDSDHDQVTVSDVLLHAIKKPVEHWTQTDKNAVVKRLKHNHWTREIVRDGERIMRIYRRPPTSSVQA
jgi:hypothetical protein